MSKEYIVPEVEVISFQATESIMSDPNLGGSVGEPDF